MHHKGSLLKDSLLKSVKSFIHQTKYFQLQYLRGIFVLMSALCNKIKETLNIVLLSIYVIFKPSMKVLVPWSMWLRLNVPINEKYRNKTIKSKDEICLNFVLA